jgi:hypothetical protein
MRVIASEKRKEGNVKRGRKHETGRPSFSSAFPYLTILFSLSFRLPRVNTNAFLYRVTSGTPHSKPSADAGVSFVRQKSLSALAHSNARSGNRSRSTSHDVTVESNPSRGRDRKIQY